MKAIRINNIVDFDNTLNQILSEENYTKLFTLFFGTELSETDESWCPDCVIADPKIRKYANQVENCILLECPVGDRNSYKGNAKHHYKIHTEVNLKAIPTLIEWTQHGPGKRLIEEECADDDKLKAF
ncbi:hypothetical protein K502DRAFT_304537, partial [Neoconidiobolus thromboides FSU 785]